MIKKLFRNIILFLKNPIIFFKVLFCRLRSFYFSRYIDQGNGKIIVTDPYLSIKIKKAKGSKLIINGNFRITPHLGGTTPVRIIMGHNSTLNINGDFIVGHGVRLVVSDNADLYFGGKKLESDSGITSDTFIMVYKKITVGYDFICAWDVFISDSDWHQIEGQKHQADVEIGDHVWIANNSSVLKGSKIGSESIVASHSKVINKEYPPMTLIGGIPARIIKRNICWNRDIKEF